MYYKIISPYQFQTVPWKNSKGSTIELLRESSGDDYFDWRVSMASVKSNSDFSDFTHYDRALVLIGGNGITLNHSNGQNDELTERFNVANFDGAWQTNAVLHDGAIQDFNVMTRQGICRSQVSTLEEKAEHRLSVDADHLLVYALGSEVTILSPDLNSTRLPASHLLQISSVKSGEWKLTGKAIICVQIQSVV